MYISMNWIKDFVDLDGLDEIALIERFTLSTAEVEEILYKGKDLDKVVAARIVEVADHPNSKKLHLLKVDAGGEVLDCVCGAPNVRKDMVVPFAMVGGKVGGKAIKEAMIAGHPSMGMCCSEEELGLSSDHSGLMELDADTPLGKDVKELFDVEDVVFEVDNKSLTNRPDLWGHYGIAREFAALTKRELRAVPRMDLAPYASLPPIDIQILEPELAYRYSGLTVENVTRRVSPVNMRIRLFYCGSRAINFLADLTNYVMLELGQPMHAFDLQKVNNIWVKKFDKAFSFQTLDGVERDVDEDTLMICADDKPVAIAGIMGGYDSEIAEDTTSLLLESANFNGVSIRKSSTRLGLRTDASMRYEKVLDPEMTVLAIERLGNLLFAADKGAKVTSSLTDKYPKPFPTISFDFDKQYVNRYTGIEIDDDEILTTLRGLGFEVSSSGGDHPTFHITVPSHRSTKDVTIPADIIEEITRIYGYDNFLITTTTSALHPATISTAKSDEHRMKDILVQMYGLHEVHSYVWCESKKYKELGIAVPDNVKLVNSLASENSVLRNSMVPTLLTVVNENKSYAPEFGVFEIGKVVEGLDGDGNCNERSKLGVAFFSRTRDEGAAYLHVRDVLSNLGNMIKHGQMTFVPHEEGDDSLAAWQHPVHTSDILLGGVTLGFLSVLHPMTQSKIDKKATIVVAQLDMAAFSSLDDASVHYVEPSKYPSIDWDLSLLVQPDTRFADMAKAWKDAEFEKVLKKVDVIDSYEGEQKSVTVRFTFESDERTLQSEEAKAVVDRILENLGEQGISMKQM